MTDTEKQPMNQTLPTKAQAMETAVRLAKLANHLIIMARREGRPLAGAEGELAEINAANIWITRLMREEAEEDKP